MIGYFMHTILLVYLVTHGIYHQGLNAHKKKTTFLKKCNNIGKTRKFM